MPDFKGKYYIHNTACVIGDVNCGKNLSVWPNAVVRGDTNRIDIGDNVNIQDNATLHVSAQYGLRIGSNVTVGHNAVVHACEIGDGTLVGTGAIILDGAIVGKDCIIGAGCLVPPNKRVPDNSVAVGSPFVIAREATPEEAQDNRQRAERYWELALNYIKTGDIY